VKRRASKAAARPRSGAASKRRAAPAPLPFFSRRWAEAAKQAVNAGPDAAARAKKIERFWDWIEKTKAHVNCRLGLAVEGLPADSPNCLLLDLEAGRCVRVRLTTREEGDRRATYLLAGSYRDWRDIMDGFDMGKAVMYRKLMLQKGEVLEFFKSIYFWTESLACIQRIPTAMSAAATR
jgi:hypothetical protein